MYVAMKQWWADWVADERGQDLVEYALLATFVALASAASFDAIRVVMNTSYVSWDNASQASWEVSAPVSAP